MNSTIEDRLQRVRTLSAFGNTACIGLMILTTLVACGLIVTAFVFPDQATCDFGAGSQPCGDLSPGVRALALLLLAAGAALLVKGLYHLSRLFRNYARGEIFTLACVRQIRSIGATVFAFGACQIALLIVTVALNGTHGIAWPPHRPVPLPFAAFISGGLIMLVSWVMELGTQLREENELTV